MTTPLATDSLPAAALPKPRLALINVVREGDYQFPQEIPLGVGAVAAFIRQQGFPVEIHQCLDFDTEEGLHRASQVKADIYGFQLNTVNYLDVRTVTARIKAIRPTALVLLGGPFLSSLAETILEHDPLFDGVVFGEGEGTVLEIMEALAQNSLEFANIAGVVWRDSAGKAQRNPPRPLIQDLDGLPFPARDLLSQARRDPVDQGLWVSVRVTTSRGCIANCSFCSVNFYTRLQKGKLWRGRSPRHVVDELEWLSRQHGARLFNFADSSFEDPGKLGKRRTAEICQEIIQRRLPLSAKVYMRCDTMVEESDLELLRLWKAAGIDVIIVGAESGSDLELEYYHKRANVEQNRQTIRLLQQTGLFCVIVGFIMFGPNSTLESLRSNIDFLREIGMTDTPNPIANVLMLIRDSRLYQELADEGRTLPADHFWENPKYRFLDPKAERAAHHWDGLFGRYPKTLQLNAQQVNFENLATRLLNPMNADIRERIEAPFAALNGAYLALKEEFGILQHAYFHRILDEIEDGASDAVLESAGEEFFEGMYGRYLPRYQRVYEESLKLAASTGLGLSGLLFNNFYSAMINQGVRRTG